jgi:hypothetical protein
LALRLADTLAQAATSQRTDEQEAEWQRCKDDRAYFVEHYVQIYNATIRRWVPFTLWPAQIDVLAALPTRQKVCLLKARQLGMTWLVLAYGLHQLIFDPIATVLLFSKRDDEAMELIRRLKGMYARLPVWMQERANVSNDHVWRLGNESEARAFPTTGGDSYTASLAIVDEADLINDLEGLLGSVGPTIDAGGQLVLLSRVDKDKPGSTFQRIYQSAVKGLTEWLGLFLPWSARPDRTEAWYEQRKAEALANEGSLDSLYEQYPATPAEALSPRSKDKRLPGPWLQQCYVPCDPIPDAGAMLLALDQLQVYQRPQEGRRYVIGADPAEGNPNSDMSALRVLDADTGEEVAALSGLFEPSVFAGHIAALSRAYHGAGALIERNNHGHTVLLWLRDHAPDVARLPGLDGRDGWLSNSIGKVQLYNDIASALKDQQVVVHHLTTYLQLASINGATLRAPKSEMDDDADAFALAHMARSRALVTQGQAGGSSRNHSNRVRSLLGGRE